MAKMTREELRENFNHFDANKDGKLEPDEFADLMQALDALEPDEDISIGFGAIDTDDSGVVEFDEFEAWFSDR